MEIFQKIFIAGLPNLWLAVVPFLVIIVYLLATGHASIGPNGKAKTSCCGDNRVERGITVFGGSSAFTFGTLWGYLAYIVGLNTIVGEIFASYAVLQFFLSCLQTVTFLLQLWRYRKDKIVIELLKAHLDACGFTTAWSLLWPLFWLSKHPKFKWLNWIRDVETVMDWVVSVPFVIVLNILFIPIGKKLVIPVITHVDFQQ